MIGNDTVSEIIFLYEDGINANYTDSDIAKVQTVRFISS